MSIKVVGNRVLVRQVESVEKTASGILLPDTAKEKPFEGEVIAVGSGRVLDDGSREVMEVKAGDRVLFSKYGGVEVKIEGVVYLVLRQDDILVVLN